MAKKVKRSLDIGALGLGQAGGNLAAEMARLGYPALALNTARSDLRSLAGPDIPEDRQLYIGLDELDGAGKDPTYGQACIQEQSASIRELVQARLGDCDAVLLCAGLGGGTGSAVAELCSVLEPLELPLAALVTLPSEAESGIVKVNAVRAVSALVERPLLARIFVDNQRIVAARGELDLLSYYPQINREILAPLHQLNTLNGDPDLRSLRSFDGEDLRKVLLSGGVVVTGHARLDIEAAPITATELESVARRLIDGGETLAAGLSVDKIAYLGLVLVASEVMLSETPTRDLEDLAEQIKKLTAGGAAYLGVYAAERARPELHLVAGSLSLPGQVQTLLETAKAEGHLLADKIRAEIPALDVAELADMQLFKVASPKRGQRRARAEAEVADPPAAEPIAVAESRREPRPKSKKKLKKDKKKQQIEARVEMPKISEKEIDDPSENNSLVTADEILPEGLDPAGPEEATGAMPIEDLQIFYADLIDRFRDAETRQDRETVARRLIRDARSEDVEIRAHAVWAMVSLGGRGFKAALQQASGDEDEEIRELARDGLRRLGE